MTRTFSNMCFGLAFGCSLFMRSFAVQDDLVWLAVLSVVLAAALTHWMPVRSMGIAGISGLFLVYSMLGGNSLPGQILITLAIFLLAAGVYLAIHNDLPDLNIITQGERNNHEV
jgi:apolipoprotein N-acyltransferase